MTEQSVRWGILATGGIAAAFTADLVDLPDAEVVAVASRSEASAKAFAERFGIERAYGDWGALAEDADIDVVYVATPHAAHRAAAGLCLAAGRNVLCEKAFTLNAREAEELVGLAREHGRFLMEAMWMYCNPLVRRLKALVDDGAIGEVRTVQADFGLAGPFPPAHRLRDPAQGGGALLDLGVYPVSFAHLLLGEPSGVTAKAVLSEEGVDLQTGALLSWDSGALASLHCSLTGGTATIASVTGSLGRIDIPNGFFHPDRFVLHRDGRDPEEFVADPADGPRNSLKHEAREVMRALRAGEKESALVPLEGTLAVMRTLDAIRDRVGVRYPGETGGTGQIGETELMPA
ncbi:putative dehydrogenase [Streptomyces sp. SAI-208]|uniref:Gfo/Idh/MocA family protein n=1 Tax=unclassified Streptomyces TaxID=2593676 RepID=UPI002475834F|nr:MULTISPECIES: Gfo/Idh/MocA family oxidoreductase [unclassified Streptomyces]MDH6519495.1 putative dehydrogenase [Streptomyces sp. SAI-090]MDH6551704.1 putative dehydrogenase [Streptomyces sp. SAI-041]MDH6610468.1 putative dehydrogenase [Streptomyces sp. SAI-208]MDH6616412.1 putative dehydrogenase [Streptomyces sp. SAI-135]